MLRKKETIKNQKFESILKIKGIILIINYINYIVYNYINY